MTTLIYTKMDNEHSQIWSGCTCDITENNLITPLKAEKQHYTSYFWT